MNQQGSPSDSNDGSKKETQYRADTERKVSKNPQKVGEVLKSQGIECNMLTENTEGPQIQRLCLYAYEE